MTRILLPILAIVFFLNGQASAADSQNAAPTVSQAWARATPAAIKIGAAYVTITAGQHADRLVGASSAIADRVEIHTHKMDGDKMSMAKIADIEIPASGTVKFGPGGHHFMLFDLRRPLKEGEDLQLVLEFAKAGKVDVKAQIFPAWSLGPDGQKAEDHSQHHSPQHMEHGPDHQKEMAPAPMQHEHDHSKHH